MKLNLKDTLVLAAGIGFFLGCATMLLKGWFRDAYFPGIVSLGFFLWFIYRKGEDYKNSRK